MTRAVLLLASIWLLVAPNSWAELSVQGNGSVSARPDLFRILISVEAEPVRPELAWQELSKTVKLLNSAVSGVGGVRDQVEVLSVGLRSRDDMLLGRASIKIETPIHDENAELLDSVQRIPYVFVRRTRYVSSKERQLRDQARSIAVRSAVEELDELAIAAGGSRGTILSIGKELKSDGIRVMDSSTRYAAQSRRQRVPLSHGMLYFHESVWVVAELTLVD